LDTDLRRGDDAKEIGQSGVEREIKI